MIDHRYTVLFKKLAFLLSSDRGNLEKNTLADVFPHLEAVVRKCDVMALKLLSPFLALIGEAKICVVLQNLRFNTTL